MALQTGEQLINLPATEIDARAQSVPEHMRVSFGWATAAIGAADSGEDAVLRWTSSDLSGLPYERFQSARLRFTVALDVREHKMIEACDAVSGEQLGLLDVRFAYVTQIYELELPVKRMEQLLRNGIRLRMVRGEVPLMFYAFVPAIDEGHVTLSPHVLFDLGTADRRAAFQAQLKSVASIQPFGWMEGCVMDALYDMAQIEPQRGWEEALQRHIALFLSPDQRHLIYEDMRSCPKDDHMNNIEATLPFALLAKLSPQHPVMAVADKFWQSNHKRSGAGTGTLTTEGCYTLAYPMAVTAVRRQDRELAEQAIDQLLIRCRALATAETVQQNNRPGGEPLVHWARGHAWYILGLVRSLVVLRQYPGAELSRLKQVEEACIHAANIVLAYQNDDGLWHCFLDDADSGTETSGSAGIAAALAIGANEGLLSSNARLAAQRACDALAQWLTPDGLLAGVSQSNRDGDRLQRGGYRVISQMGMGLMGQLIAALHKGT